MASPWSIAAMGWTVTVLGWLLSPVISLIITKLVARLGFDTSEELHKLKWNTVRDLKKMLGVVEELRMKEAARDERSRSGDDLAALNMFDTRLKSALYQAEDILDLVEYHRIQKELTGGDDGRWVQQLIQAAGASIVAQGRATWASVQRLLHTAGASIVWYCIDIIPAPLLQFLQSMKQKLGHVFGGIIGLWSSGALLPVSQATPNVGVNKICSWWRHLVTNISSCGSAVLKWSADRIADARYYRDWSYEQVGIKSDLQKDGSVPFTERIRLKKQIKDIEYILNSLKKSDLLDQNGSISCIVENNDKESSSKQKELIDEMYRSIGQVFGRKELRDDIVNKLHERPDTKSADSNTSKPYSVIGIYGITGSGKSTLAQYVCDYEKEEGHFDLIMFIHVGNTFKLGDIFYNMLAQIQQKEPSKDKDPKLLKTELEEELKGKCFLLVLDDVWVNVDKWMERRILLGVLDVGKSGSRILVTTQNKDAAAALGAQDEMQIQIPDLEDEEYLKMFMHYALEVNQGTSTDNERYIEIARKITRKLHRSPIAARTVAARLQSNNNIDFWETTANLDMLNETMGALWWSYQQLGVDIRRCFAFFSIFPKEFELRPDKLVRMWIAQGFINTRSNAIEELEALGRMYFNELLTFSFIQVRITPRYGKDIVEYIIHDLLLELVQRVYGSEFYRIDLKNGSDIIKKDVRHVFIETNNLADIIKKNLDMGNLQTLIIKESKVSKEINRDDLQGILKHLCMRLTKLRILVIKPARVLWSVPACINQMKHLRYLGFIGGWYHIFFPSTFSKLYQIQIIDIHSHIATCPRDMANLNYLWHSSAPLSFPNIGRLSSLQTLKEFEVKKEQGFELKQLKHLNNLQGDLSIQGLDFVGSKKEAIEARLKHKQGLRTLRLTFKGEHRLRRELEVVPDVDAEVLEGLCPPKDLQELRIASYRGSRYPRWMLSRHHTDAPKQLHKLELYSCSQLASIPKGSQLFIGLRKLEIWNCDWDMLPENMEGLLSLQTLQIWSCKKIERLPTLPQALKSIDICGCRMLRSIGLVDCPRHTSPEYNQDTGTPEQPPHPIIGCPSLVSLIVFACDNLVTIPNLPPSLKDLSIRKCGELCSMSGQLGGLEELHIDECDKLQSIDSLGDASSLESLSLNRCPCLASLGSSSGPGSYLALRRLRIEYCPAMDMKQFNKIVLDWDMLPENMEGLLSLETLPQTLKSIDISGCDMLRSIGLVDCPRLSSPEYSQNTARTGTPEQSPYPIIGCPSLVSLVIIHCANLVTITNLPPSLKKLSISRCGELCSVSGQLGGLQELHIDTCNKLQSVDSLGDASSLGRLTLSCCRCLASLGSSGGTGSYVALWMLKIKYCPAMDMKQFNKTVLDGLVIKEIADALSSIPDERA